MLATSEAALAALGWPAVPLSPDVLGTSWDDGATPYRSVLVVDDEEGHVVFYTQAPFTVPPHRRAAAARLVTRANWGLPAAALELDWDTGECRVRCGVHLEAASGSAEPLTRAILAAAAVASVYLPALARVIDGVDPDVAARAAETA